MSNKALRQAFERGARHVRDLYLLPIDPARLAADALYARGAYPPAPQTRPRIVEVPYGLLRGPARYVNGRVELQNEKTGEWFASNWYGPNAEVDRFTPEELIFLADLKANPTETVEVDD